MFKTSKDREPSPCVPSMVIKDVINAIFIFLLQLLNFLVFAYLSLTTNLPLFIFILLVINFLIALLFKGNCKTHIVQVILAWLYSILFFVLVFMYMFVNQSDLGIALSIFANLFGFTAPDLICIIILLIKKIIKNT